MSQADVNLILQGLQQGQQRAQQAAQLQQQRDEFTQQHDLAVKALNAQEAAQKALREHSQAQLALEYAQHPDVIQNLPGVQNLGGISGLTTGDPNTETQQNLYQLPINDVNTGQPMTMVAPTPNAAANIAATKKRIELAPEIDARNKQATLEHINRMAELGQSEAASKDLEKNRQLFEANQQTERLAAEERFKNANLDFEKWKTNQDNQLRKTLGEMQYGTNIGGMSPDAYKNALTNVFTGQQTIGDYDKQFQNKGAKQKLSTDLLGLGGVSLNQKQIDSLHHVDMLKGILDKVDQFVDLNNSGGIHVPTLMALQDSIKSNMGEFAATVQNEPGRKAGWMIRGGENAAVPHIIDLANMNPFKREKIAKDINDFFDTQLNNIPKKQRNIIKHAYGIDSKFAPRGAKIGQTESTTKPTTADDYLKSLGVQ